MSQRAKDFVRQSGVEVQSTNSNSNDEFARELEMEMERANRARVPFSVHLPVRLDLSPVKCRFLNAFNKT